MKCCCSSQGLLCTSWFANLPSGRGKCSSKVPKQHFRALLGVVANTFGPAPFPGWLARTWLSCNYCWQQELPAPLHSFWRTNSFLSPGSGHKREFQVSHLLFYVHCPCAQTKSWHPVKDLSHKAQEEALEGLLHPWALPTSIYGKSKLLKW